MFQNNKEGSKILLKFNMFNILSLFNLESRQFFVKKYDDLTFIETPV